MPPDRLNLIEVVKILKSSISLGYCANSSESGTFYHSSEGHSSHGIRYLGLLDELGIKHHLGIYVAKHYLLSDGFLFISVKPLSETGPQTELDANSFSRINAPGQIDGDSLDMLWCFAPEALAYAAMGIESVGESCFDSSPTYMALQLTCSKGTTGCLVQDVGDVIASAPHVVVDKLTSIGLVVKCTVVREKKNEIIGVQQSVEDASSLGKRKRGQGGMSREVDNKATMIHSKIFSSAYEPSIYGLRRTSNQDDLQVIYDYIKTVMDHMKIDALPVAELARVIGVHRHFLNNLCYCLVSSVGKESPISFDQADCRILHENGTLGVTSKTWRVAVNKHWGREESSDTDPCSARNLPLHEFIGSRINLSSDGITSSDLRQLAATSGKRAAKIFSRYISVFRQPTKRFQEWKSVCSKLMPDLPDAHQSAAHVSAKVQVQSHSSDVKCSLVTQQPVTTTDSSALTDRQLEHTKVVLNLLKEGEATASEIVQALRRHQRESRSTTIRGSTSTGSVDKRTMERLLVRMQSSQQIILRYQQSSEDGEPTAYFALSSDAAAAMSAQQVDPTAVAAAKAGTENCPDLSNNEDVKNVFKKERRYRKRMLEYISSSTSSSSCSSTSTSIVDAESVFSPLSRSELCDLRLTAEAVKSGGLVSCMHFHFHLMRVVKSRMGAFESSSSVLQPLHFRPNAILKSFPAALFLQCFQYSETSSWQLPTDLGNFVSRTGLAEGASIGYLLKLEQDAITDGAVYKYIWECSLVDRTLVILQLTALGILKSVDFERLQRAFAGNRSAAAAPVIRELEAVLLDNSFQQYQKCGIYAADVQQMRYFAVACWNQNNSAVRELLSEGVCLEVMSCTYQLNVIPHCSWSQVWSARDVLAHWKCALLPAMNIDFTGACSSDLDGVAAIALFNSRKRESSRIDDQSRITPMKVANMIVYMREQLGAFPWLKDGNCNWTLLRSANGGTSFNAHDEARPQKRKVQHSRNADTSVVEVEGQQKQQQRQPQQSSLPQQRQTSALEVAAISPHEKGALDAEHVSTTVSSIAAEISALENGEYDLTKSVKFGSDESFDRALGLRAVVSNQQKWIVYSQCVFDFLVKLPPDGRVPDALLPKSDTGKRLQQCGVSAESSFLEVAWMDLSFRNIPKGVRNRSCFTNSKMLSAVRSLRVRIIQRMQGDPRLRRLLAWILCFERGIPDSSPLLQHINPIISEQRVDKAWLSTVRSVRNLLLQMHLTDDPRSYRSASKQLRRFPLETVKGVNREFYIRGWLQKSGRCLQDGCGCLGRERHHVMKIYEPSQRFWMLFEGVLLSPFYKTLLEISHSDAGSNSGLLPPLLKLCSCFSMQIPIIPILAISHACAFSAEVFGTVLHIQSGKRDEFISEESALETDDASCQLFTTRSGSGFNSSEAGLASDSRFCQKQLSILDVSISAKHSLGMWEFNNASESLLPSSTSSKSAAAAATGEDPAPWLDSEGQTNARVFISFAAKAIATVTDCPGCTAEKIQSGMWVLSLSHTQQLLTVLQDRGMIFSRRVACSVSVPYISDIFNRKSCIQSSTTVYFAATGK